MRATITERQENVGFTRHRRNTTFTHLGNQMVTDHHDFPWSIHDPVEKRGESPIRFPAASTDRRPPWNAGDDVFPFPAAGAKWSDPVATGDGLLRSDHRTTHPYAVTVGPFHRIMDVDPFLETSVMKTF
jgi:hypothetical protein